MTAKSLYMYRGVRSTMRSSCSDRHVRPAGRRPFKQRVRHVKAFPSQEAVTDSYGYWAFCINFFKLQLHEGTLYKLPNIRNQPLPLERQLVVITVSSIGYGFLAFHLGYGF
jgi:hypothetical protein